MVAPQRSQRGASVEIAHSKLSKLQAVPACVVTRKACSDSFPHFEQRRFIASPPSSGSPVRLLSRVALGGAQRAASLRLVVADRAADAPLHASRDLLDLALGAFLRLGGLTLRAALELTRAALGLGAFAADQ